MNRYEADVLRTLLFEPYTSQRLLAEYLGLSVGVVNRSLKQLLNDEFVDHEFRPTAKANEAVRINAPKNAIILAAGMGMRMVPINLSTPKALLEVRGECLIERIIKQLHEAGVTDITIIVGFMKEAFEYLIDQYGVTLIINDQYASTNNYYSLSLVADHINNTYIIPCDIWCEENPFGKVELYSWYMVSDRLVSESNVRVNRKTELSRIPDNKNGNRMIGISYLLDSDAAIVRSRLKSCQAKHIEDFWEETLYNQDRMIILSKVVKDDCVAEINTYEQLRDLDSGSNQLQSDAIGVIATSLHCKDNEIKDITVLKKGMTNRSFLFTVKGLKYIMRIPGEGTERLIDRKNEADAFRAIRALGFCDDPIYLNADNGYKITSFLESVRPCDPNNIEDLKCCMDKLKDLHRLKLAVPHTFDLWKQIEYYESLWGTEKSIYRDYEQTKNRIESLCDYVDGLEKDWCLTHIDAVPDNFLFYKDKDSKKESLQLIDWEYAGMQDPHVDLAMFCIYSLYSKEQCDRLIDIYFDYACDKITRVKIYCYIAICGLIWSNWCEYKRQLGVEFGEYSLRQYRFAKEFYRYAIALKESVSVEKQ